MKCILSCVFFAFSLTVYCQKDSTISRLSIGLNFSLDYCYRTLDADPMASAFADLRNATEIPKFGYTSGITLLYKLTNNISIQTALQFSDKGERTNQTPLIWLEPDSAFPIASSFNFHYQYIDLPMKVNYYFFKPPLRGFVSGGLISSFFLQRNTEAILEYSDGSVHRRDSFESDGLAAINFAVTAGLGVEADVVKGIKLRFEPVFRYSFTPTVIGSPIRHYLQSTGANFVVMYKL
ncbi:MAG: PorT family protein [Flavobacteriales bacterium]|nr:PorT family protein [Flavobacteriales bacterium]